MNLDRPPLSDLLGAVKELLDARREWEERATVSIPAGRARFDAAWLSLIALCEGQGAIGGRESTMPPEDRPPVGEEPATLAPRPEWRAERDPQFGGMFVRSYPGGQIICSVPRDMEATARDIARDHNERDRLLGVVKILATDVCESPDFIGDTDIPADKQPWPLNDNRNWRNCGECDSCKARTALSGEERSDG